MEALVNTVLLAAHPSLRERCNAAKVVSVLEELGAYDSSALRSLLSSFTDTVAHKLKEEEAAPPALVAALATHVDSGSLSEPQNIGGAMDATAATSSSSSAAAAVTPRTVKAKAGGGKHSTLQQKSIGAFFAGGTRTTYATLPGIGRQIRSVTSLTPEQLQAVGKAPEKFTSCAKGCGQTFLHGPARVAHEKFCSGRAAETAAEVAAAAEAAASAATTTQPATAVTEAAAEAADSSDDEQPPAKAPKLRADGGIKQSGLRQGEKKGMKHSLYFKLEVVRTLRRLQSLEKRWEKAPSGWRGAGIETSEIHKGVHPSLVSKWGGKEDELHMALQHENRVSRKQKHRTGTMATFQSRGARRTTLHRGRAPPEPGVA